MAAAHN